MEALNGVCLNFLIHNFYHAVSPGMLNQCCPVLNVVFLADSDERMHLVFWFSGFDQQVVAELDTIVGEDFLDLEGILGQCLPQKSGGGSHALVVVQFQVNIARSPVDGDKKTVLSRS